MRKVSILVAFCLLTSPAFPAEPGAKPLTNAELQKKVSELELQLAQFKAALDTAMKQRDLANQAYNNELVNEAARGASVPSPAKP